MTSQQRRSRATFWIVFICAWVIVASLGLSSWTFVRQSQSETIRKADLKAQSSTKVSTCFNQVENGPAVLGALRLIDTLATNSIKANKAALKAQPTSPLTPSRKAALGRIGPARADLRRLIRQSQAKVPKVADCFKLAAQLGVDPKPFQPKGKG